MENTVSYIEYALDKVDKTIRLMTTKEDKTINTALDETRRPIIIGLWVIVILSAVTLIWGALAPIDSAVVSRGSITLLSNKKTIQHLEGGIIEELFVKDGDLVKEGDNLIRLNNVASSASRDAVKGQLYTARAARSRFISMRDGLDEIAFDNDIIKSSATDSDVVDIVSTQNSLFKYNIAAHNAKLDSLGQKIIQSEEQIKGISIQKETTRISLDLLSEQIKSVASLVAKGYDTKTHLIQLQMQAKALEGNMGQYEAQIAQAEQNIIETKITIENQKNEFAIAISDGLRESQSIISDLSDKLRAAEDVASRSIITAPTSGVVNALKFHTIGGIIGSGAPIMEIIPQDDQLIIESRVRPVDIDVVHAGLDVNVMLTAYKARTTPKVPGRVIQVSADRIADTFSNPPDSYYLARIEVDKNFLNKMEKKVDLYPGMPVDVLIKTGSRSFLSYLFSPITNSLEKAFREE
ncbi:HlyD family type I secretion periplasmic adaptor subunit [Rickettsiales bacterium]|nr:HlyD family type I secretion periplasmic adaptor subunit [Rickettsiales bacterium]